MSDFDFLAVNLDDVVEPQLLPKGTEARVKIVGVNPKPEYSLLEVELEVQETLNGENVVSVPIIRHALFFPKPDDDQKKTNNKKLGLKNFYSAMGLSPSQDPSAYVGAEAWCKVNIEESEEYGDRNRVAYNGFISQS